MALPMAELQSFWRERIKPGNARLVLAGRFDAARVRARIESAFASLPAGTPPVPREGPGAILRGTLVMTQEPGAAIALAVGAPPLDGPLFPAFLVHASRLAQAAQPPRTWRVQYDPVRRPGMLLVTSPVGAAEQPEPAAARVRSEIREIPHPPARCRRFSRAPRISSLSSSKQASTPPSAHATRRRSRSPVRGEPSSSSRARRSPRHSRA
ncbi:MAG: insulinase family protein [Myxococcales bacterium]